MSDLSSQLSAFKNKIKNGASVPVARRPTVQAPVAATPPTPRAKRPADSVNEAFKRQKANMGEVSGSHLSTQLHLAVEYIKSHDAPVPVHKLQNYLAFDVSRSLLPLLREIDRIKYDPDNQTIEYVSLHNIRDGDDLLNFLRSQPTFKGTSVKDLRDGWAGCIPAITELEEHGKILVLRNKKENTPRLVWANLGGDMDTVDEEFKNMWSEIKLPPRDSLYQALIDQSLKPTGADPQAVKKKPAVAEKKQRKARRGKITNTHMKGILKDYSQIV